MARLEVFLEPPEPEQGGLTLRQFALTREQYAAFCAANRDLRIERLATGEVIIMPPAHSRTGFQNVRIVSQLDVWAMRDGGGYAFDSSTGFDLPNGANRAPDAAWVLKSRLHALSPDDKEGFFPLSPDFIVELRPRSDRLAEVKARMEEYLENGTRLGWLIDPFERKLHVYRPGAAVETLDEPLSVSGDPELPGFRLDLQDIWNPPL